jgi:N-acetylglutamate synthase-like GNAT family acetyltransferase
MIQIRTPKTKDEFKAYYALRFRVLREPWGQPKGTEKDDYEPISQHLMAVDDQSGAVVGVIKWLERAPGVAWLSHVAVAPEYQRRGIGKLLMKTVEETARAQGFQAIGANSRLTSTEYFEKQGYTLAGLPTHYFGTVQVVWMEKTL